MTLNEFQAKAMTTCMPSSRNLSYMLLNLVGEVGEFSSKIGKHIRKGNMRIVENSLFCELENKEWLKADEELMKEAGDILWQLSGLCFVMGWDLEEVALGNLAKLAARKQAGTIDGNGDGIIRGQ